MPENIALLVIVRLTKTHKIAIAGVAAARRRRPRVLRWCRATRRPPRPRPPSPRPRSPYSLASSVKSRPGRRHRAAAPPTPLQGRGRRGQGEGRGDAAAAKAKAAKAAAAAKKKAAAAGRRQGRPPPRPPQGQGRAAEAAASRRQAAQGRGRRKTLRQQPRRLDPRVPRHHEGTRASRARYNGLHRNIIRESSRQPERDQQLGHQRHQRHPVEGPAPGHPADLRGVPRRRHVVEHLRPGRQHHRRRATTRPTGTARSTTSTARTEASADAPHDAEGRHPGQGCRPSACVRAVPCYLRMTSGSWRRSSGPRRSRRSTPRTSRTTMSMPQAPAVCSHSGSSARRVRRVPGSIVVRGPAWRPPRRPPSGTASATTNCSTPGVPYS